MGKFGIYAISMVLFRCVDPRQRTQGTELREAKARLRRAYKEEVPKSVERPKEQRSTKSRCKSENKGESRKLSDPQGELVTHFPEASDVRLTHMSLRWKPLYEIYMMMFC